MGHQNVTQLFSSNLLNESSLARSLGEEFPLCGNNAMVFHWADFYETCDAIKKQLMSGQFLMDDFKLRENALTRLSQIPVWIRSSKGIEQTTMHTLYENYIFNHKVVDPFLPREISFISSSGPFKTMSISECFNKSTYRDFVLVYLLQEKLPRRDFRIRLRSKVLFQYGPQFSESQLVSLEQLGSHGMLFSMESETFLKKFSQEEMVRIMINSKMLNLPEDSNVADIRKHLAPYSYNLLYSAQSSDAIVCRMGDISVQSSFDFSNNKKVFLFVPYGKIIDGQNSGIKTIQRFVETSRDLIRDEYRLNLLKSA